MAQFEERVVSVLQDLSEARNRIANTMEENAYKTDPIERIKLARAQAMSDTFKDRLIEQGDEPFVKWAENQVNISFDELAEANDNIDDV